ncbi:MAG: HAMP domain-containing sensor histidine kinase [Cyanobacteria bacterium P01_D01_bin.128]
MAKPNLQSRLLLSYLIVMGVGIVTLASIGWLYSPRLFVVSLKRIEGRGFRVQQMQTQLVKGFQFAWTRGMMWSILIGGSAAGGLSYVVSQRIVRPLQQIEAVTEKFAHGQLDQRVPPQTIPEFNRLASSFNRMATDLEGVEHRRRQLVGDLTHELRTPLTILRGYLEGLADGTVTADAEIYSRLATETSRLQRLVDDLQELSKLEAGYLPIQAQPIELPSLLERVVQRFVDQIPADRDLRIALDSPEKLPLALADPERVEQILINLLGNAVRYTPKGQITVWAWTEANQLSTLWIAIADTGVGIAPEDLPHVFERFWRADRSRDRSSGGTGIGLAICQRLVELQGGQINVESELNRGTTFWFSLKTA